MSARLTSRHRRALAPDDGGFTASMIRHHIDDCLANVPRDALAAQVALGMGDDDTAYDYLAAVVAAVREAAVSMNELRRETRKGGE